MELDLGKCASALLTTLPYKGAVIWVGQKITVKSDAKILTHLQVCFNSTKLPISESVSAVNARAGLADAFSNQRISGVETCR